MIIPPGDNAICVSVRYVISTVFCVLARHSCDAPSFDESVKFPITAKTLSSCANCVHRVTVPVVPIGQNVWNTGTILRPAIPPLALMSSM